MNEKFRKITKIDKAGLGDKVREWSLTMSYREIANKLKSEYGLDISYVAVGDYLKEYSQALREQRAEMIQREKDFLKITQPLVSDAVIRALEETYERAGEAYRNYLDALKNNRQSDAQKWFRLYTQAMHVHNQALSQSVTAAGFRQRVEVKGEQDVNLRVKLWELLGYEE